MDKYWGGAKSQCDWEVSLSSDPRAQQPRVWYGGYGQQPPYLQPEPHLHRYPHQCSWYRRRKRGILTLFNGKVFLEVINLTGTIQRRSRVDVFAVDAILGVPLECTAEVTQSGLPFVTEVLFQLLPQEVREFGTQVPMVPGTFSETVQESLNRHSFGEGNMDKAHSVSKRSKIIPLCQRVYRRSEVV